MDQLPMKLSERINEWAIENFESDVAVFADEVAQLEAKNEKLQELKLFCYAEAQTLGDGRDFSLAAYMLRDLPTTKRAELVELCQVMSEETASKGDWEGLKRWWLDAALKAGDD